MARKPRIHLPGGYYHVMMRGNFGHDIFFSAADRTRFLFLIQEGVERYGHRVHAFCLMDNHVHLLIQIGTIPLSKIIQNLSFRYTRYINKQKQEIGHLFQGRYKSILVDADNYLLELIRYIHLNPVSAGLCEKVADYEWSSHKAYLGKVAVPWLYTEEVLVRFSTDESRARERLVDFVSWGVDEGSHEGFQKGSCLGLILGDDQFAEQVLQRSQSVMQKPSNAAEVLASVCAEYDIDVSIMYQQGKSHRYSEARAMSAFIVQQLEGVTLTALAKELGRDLSALSQSAGRLQKKMKENKEIRNKVDRVMNAIMIHNCQA